MRTRENILDNPTITVSRPKMESQRDTLVEQISGQCNDTYCELETIVLHFLISAKERDEETFRIAALKLVNFLTRQELNSLFSSLKVVIEEKDLKWIYSILQDGILTDE